MFCHPYFSPQPCACIAHTGLSHGLGGGAPQFVFQHADHASALFQELFQAICSLTADAALDFQSVMPFQRNADLAEHPCLGAPGCAPCQVRRCRFPAFGVCARSFFWPVPGASRPFAFPSLAMHFLFAFCSWP